MAALLDMMILICQAGGIVISRLFLIMIEVELSPYSDENGNLIECNGNYPGCKVRFNGKNNKVKISPSAKLTRLTLQFDCDDGSFNIGPHEKNRESFKGFVRIGWKSKVNIGNDVTCTNPCNMSAVERASISVGDDCMLATRNIIRTDDSHPIFDVRSEKRINTSRDIKIGRHVWLSINSAVWSGARIGDGCVVGYQSFVKGEFPNNCIIAGTPARIVRRNIAWERPHLSLSQPWVKPDSRSIKKSPYWNTTKERGSYPTIVKTSWRYVRIIIPKNMRPTVKKFVRVLFRRSVSKMHK